MLQPPQGVKISAYIFFGLAALTLLGACAFVAFIGLQMANPEAMDMEGDGTVGFAIMSCFTLLFAILYGATGYGLLKLQGWARITAIILAILSLCSFPIGTILGGVVLYFMFQAENAQSFS